MKEPKPVATDNASRLSGIRSLPHDDDERRSREDSEFGQTIFTRPPVLLPRWLRGGRRGKRA